MITCGVALVVIALGLTQDRAAADSTPMRLSLDGRSWSSSIDRALFIGDRPLIPGEEDQVAFWVRNDSTDAAHLSLELADVGGDLRLGSHIALSARIDGRAFPLNGPLPVLVVPPGGADPAEIRLVARLSGDAGNDVKGRSLAFRLRVTLTEQPSSPDPSSDQAPLTATSIVPAFLSSTGGPALGWSVLGVALVLTAGGVFVLRRRGSGVGR